MARMRGLYRAFSRAELPRIARTLLPAAPIFCFHNVVADGEEGRGDPSLHLSRSEFEAIIAWVHGTYTVIPLWELARRALAGQQLSGLAALTFDDAYTGVAQHALPILRSTGLPSTVFVVPAFAERPTPTWWDALATAGRLSDEARERALHAQKGLHDMVFAEGGDEVAHGVLPDSYVPADWERLMAVAGDDLTFESHTARHPNLTALDDEELVEELVLPRRLIAERTGRRPQAIAYPYGLLDQRVISAARSAGYDAGYTLEPRPVRGRSTALALPRVNVPAGISLEALECWAAGLNPNRWI